MGIREKRESIIQRAGGTKTVNVAVLRRDVVVMHGGQRRLAGKRTNCSTARSL